MMNTPSPDRTFEIEINIKPSDIDQLGHVNNVIYLRWVQEVATAHWYDLASKKEQERLLWVVIRHEIDYKRPALKNDIVIARTWVGKSSQRLFERFTELVRKSDRKLLAKARTLWCPIDAKTMKPVAAGPGVYRKFSTAPGHGD